MENSKNEVISLFLSDENIKHDEYIYHFDQVIEPINYLNMCSNSNPDLNIDIDLSNPSSPILILQPDISSSFLSSSVSEISAADMSSSSSRPNSSWSVSLPPDFDSPLYSSDSMSEKVDHIDSSIDSSGDSSGKSQYTASPNEFLNRSQPIINQSKYNPKRGIGHFSFYNYRQNSKKNMPSPFSSRFFTVSCNNNTLDKPIFYHKF
jgi:hypothetical protein